MRYEYGTLLCEVKDGMIQIATKQFVEEQLVTKWMPLNDVLLDGERVVGFIRDRFGRDFVTIERVSEPDDSFEREGGETIEVDLDRLATNGAPEFKYKHVDTDKIVDVFMEGFRYLHDLTSGDYAGPYYLEGTTAGDQEDRENDG